MDKKRVAAGEFLIWKEPDYWRALDRMKEQDRAAVDVCNDEDLPGISALQAFKRSNPKFARAYEAAWESLSLEVQTASTRLGKKFKKQAARMRRAGNTNGEIAKELGVTQLTVHRHLVGVPFPERTHCNKGHLYPLDQKGRKHCQICNTEWKRRHNGSVSRAEAKKMKVTISCFKCGTPVEASYLAKNRRVQCKGCFREYHRVYEANRIRDNA
jgi:DNA-directed RNA polymerase subunit N (RpoN/RPB10)